MRYIWSLLLATMLLGGAALGYRPVEEHRDTLFQASTISALLIGVFDGEMTFRELKEHGDFGLGTLNGLDGEMIALDGRFYQIRTDGIARLIDGAAKTPFAVVKQFRADRTVPLVGPADLAQLGQYLDRSIPTRNVFHAIRIDGRFRSMTTRSVPRQSLPYPPLVEATKRQQVFTFRDVQGTMVGFRTPEWMSAVNVPGYHFHFLTADRKSGGHVLACELERATAALDDVHDFRMALPHDDAFGHADLTPDRAALEQAERAPKK
jgi:acetolactate decarboxylase